MFKNKITPFLYFLLIPAFNACKGPETGVNAYNYQINKSAEFTSAAVVCAHPLASEVGSNIMKNGGNAIDAAIATQWALAVVYPGAGNIGGGGFMVARFNNQPAFTLDYRETAPSKASENMYLNEDGTANTRLSQNGHLSSGIPGTPSGMYAALKYAKLPMKTLLEPAIKLAELGFAITQSEADNLNSSKEGFLRNNTTSPVFVREDRPWKAGDTLVQKDLANTLKRIRDNGLKGFYEGETARLLVNEMEKGGGIISLEDLKSYKTIERESIVFNYKGYEIITMPPPSSGGILLQQMLGMLSTKELSRYPFQSEKSVQLITEVERYAYADRAEYLGDPDFVKVPYKQLVSATYLANRMAAFDSTKAGVSNNVKPGVLPKESEQTTHISIIDKEGNAVSVTTTLNGHYGSKTVVSGAGFLLNNEMDDFSIQPGVPNMYGAIGGAANAIQPNKRMLSSMTPTILLKDNKPFMVVGTPGGTTIITSVLQSIINVVDYGMSATDAVNKPKFHHQWLPDRIDVEDDFDVNTIEQLKKLGYTIYNRGKIGRTEMILIKENKKIDAVADKRGNDSVAGF